MTKNSLLYVYIELCKKYVGVGVNMALWREYLFSDSIFFILFFQKGIIIVHEIKINS